MTCRETCWCLTNGARKQHKTKSCCYRPQKMYLKAPWTAFTHKLQLHWVVERTVLKYNLEARVVFLFSAVYTYTKLHLRGTLCFTPVHLTTQKYIVKSSTLTSYNIKVLLYASVLIIRLYLEPNLYIICVWPIAEISPLRYTLSEMCRY